MARVRNRTPAEAENSGLGESLDPLFARDRIDMLLLLIAEDTDANEYSFVRRS